MHGLTVRVPQNMDELCTLLEQGDDGTKILAGGTDLVVNMHKGHMAPERVLDISRLTELKKIEYRENHVSIGALVTFTELERSPIIGKEASCLQEAAAGVGSRQIRNLATIGGNIANAAPTADGAAALLSLGGEVLVVGSEGGVWTSLDAFLGKDGKPCLSHREFIAKIRFPKSTEGFRSAFAKVGLRSTVTIAQLILSCTIKTDPSMTLVEDCAIVLGAVGPRCFLDRATMGWLKGQTISPALQKEFAVRLCASVDSAIPGRASLPYKRIAIGGLADDIFKSLFPSAQNAP
jgi:CO/xanthine dehydrogenase FAD-binding subunit